MSQPTFINLSLKDRSCKTEIQLVRIFKGFNKSV